MPRRARRTTEDDDFLEQLNCLETGRSSARSQSSRHTWRSGLIPPFLEPPHRIPSHFPVPAGTLAQVPGLNHPDLSRGQRRYLHSTAQIYSMDGSKRALSDSYYGLLMSELLRGGGAPDSHKRYTVWIYGNHKRLYETNPAIWRPPRKLKHSREVPAAEDDAATAESGEKQRSPSHCGDRSGRDGEHSERRRETDDAKSRSPTKLTNERLQRESEQQQQQTPQSPPTRRNLPPPGSARGARGPRAHADESDHNNEMVIIKAATVPPTRPARLQSARRSGQQKSPASATAAAGAKNSKRDNEEAVDHDGSADGQRPRDLSKIMY